MKNPGASVIACLGTILLLSASMKKVSGQQPDMIAEKKNLVRTIQSIASDSSLSLPVINNLESRTSEILSSIERNRRLNAVEKDKAAKSLFYFLRETNKYIARKKIHLYEISDALQSYQIVLTALLKREQLLPVMRPLSTINTELVAAAFTQYKEHSLLDDIATYKRVTALPEYILPFLESKPGFRFADSLLLDVVTADPVSIVYFLRKQDAALQQRIRNTPNNYIRQVALLSNDKNGADLAIFAPQMARGVISAEEILRVRTEPVKYFQLLVNSMLEARNALTSKLMRTGIRDKAMSFYVKEINELHNASEPVRFASVNTLRAQDLYFIITNCEDELYTSSYLGLYKRLMNRLNGQAVDSLFDLVQWENFDVFIRMAANYNVLDDFLQRLSPGKLKEVLQLFIGYIETDSGEALEKAMDIADSFGALSSSPEILDMFQSEIKSNLDRCNAKHHMMGVRLYGILNDMLNLSRQKNGLEKLWLVLGDYEILKQASLEDAGHNITELVLFYGDEDGVASFGNFLKSYSDKSKWTISRNEYWVNIHSTSKPMVSIFANLPLNAEKRLDLEAQDKLFAHLQAENRQAAILVHRGHSYHLEKSLKRLSPSVKLAILGSCGGYNKSISIATINPDIQIIGSKKTGSKSINDPILDMINESLSNGKDLHWPSIWEKLGNRFKKDPSMFAMFNEYFPPSHNMGLFLLKLYQSNSRIVQQ